MTGGARHHAPRDRSAAAISSADKAWNAMVERGSAQLLAKCLLYFQRHHPNAGESNHGQ